MMDSVECVNVNLKWGKQMYKDIKINLSAGLPLFQAQIFSLTGVPPDRQKLLHKGSQIKDLEVPVITNGMLIYLIGSSNEDPCKPPPVVNDDLRKGLQQTSLIVKPEEHSLPIILFNLGNTCYLNATIQFLRCIPELRQSLLEYSGGVSGNEDQNSLSSISMTTALKELFKILDETLQDKVISPVNLLHVLQMVAPNFAQKDKNGSLQQQDANECWSLIIRMIQNKLPSLKDESKKHRSFVDQFMVGKYRAESKCKENDEPSTTAEESFLQLSCFISQEVKFMVSGIRLSLQEEIQKYSEVLKRDAKYSRTYKISRLPAYLTIHFMRFYYKEKVNMNTKILREVKFPIIFDAYEFCTDELKEKLTVMREKFRLDEEYMANESSRIDISAPSSSGDEEKEGSTHSFSFDDDTGSNNSGYYELRAVITHKGRTSQAGHYVCWVKLAKSKNLWAKVDDDVRFSDIPDEDILHLAGGSDIHTAYMLLYGPRILKQRDPVKTVPS